MLTRRATFCRTILPKGWRMKQLVLLFLIGFSCAIAAAQSNPPISLSIAIPKDHIHVGQKPWVHLTVKNLTGEEITYPHDQVYVEGEHGEPPATEWGRLRKNNQLGGGFTPSIGPGESFTMKYDLSAFYDLSKPGKYSVYIEVSTAFHATGWKGDWMRSPVAHFEIQAPIEGKCPQNPSPLTGDKSASHSQCDFEIVGGKFPTVIVPFTPFSS